MKKSLLSVSTLIFILLILAGRTILLFKKDILVFNSYFLQGLFSDLIFTLLILGIIIFSRKMSVILSYILSIPLVLFYIANLEYIYALDNVINVRDITFITNSQFLEGSFTNLSFSLYGFIVVISLILLIMVINYVFKTKREKMNFATSSIYLLGIFIIGFTIILLSSNDWRKSNFVFASLDNTVKSLVYSDPKVSESEFVMHNIEKKVWGEEIVSQGVSLLPEKEKLSSEKKNVLVVVMEGITGSYLKDSQDFLETSNHFTFSSFEKVNNNSIVVPNFITHNNQTIRGLYSILSGDYPKLDASTPKAYDFIQNPSSKLMLPEILKSEGYNTAYIQASPLEFMSKDKFMSTAGFDKVIGAESFSESYVPFGWGIDDGAFFDQVPKLLEEINSEGKPWFTTLLTVGTHHPYAVPEELNGSEIDRKEAAVRYLDQSLSKFIDYLKSSEFLKDTIVIFTSDESHGVKDQLYGSNMGICLVYSPLINGNIINDEVFGTKDIKNSILDIVNSSDHEGDVGRSFFRKYSHDYPILFSSHYNGDLFYSIKKGEIYQLNNKYELNRITTSNGEMFSQNYKTEKIHDKELKNEMILMSKYVNKSFNDNQTFKIIENQIYNVKEGHEIKLTDGQFLTLPEKKYVNIVVDYELVDPKDGDGVVFYMYTGTEGEILEKSGDSNSHRKGRIVYSFYNKEEENLYSFNMKMRAISPQTGNIKVDIKSLAVLFDNNQIAGETFNVYNLKEPYLIDNIIPFMYAQNGASFLNDKLIYVKASNEEQNIVYGPYLNYPEGRYSLVYKIRLKDSNKLRSDQVLFSLSAFSMQSGLLAEQEYSINKMTYEDGNYLAVLPYEIKGNAVPDLELKMQGKNEVEFEIMNIQTIIQE